MTQPKQPEVGPIGRNLIEAVASLRRARGMTYKKLSVALSEAGRPIFPLGLSRMARGERRVDVDELVALAQVLGVEPIELLQPLEEATPRRPAVTVRASTGGLFTTEALAGYLGEVSVRTLEDWRRLGLGPDFVTLSAKMVRYRPEAVDRWLDSLERKSRAGNSG